MHALSGFFNFCNGMKKILFVIIFVVAIFVINFLLGLTLYNPTVAVPAYGWLEKYHLVKIYEQVESALPFNGGSKSLYPIVPARNINRSLFFGPRAAVQGVVRAVQKVTDGDWHVNVEDSDGSVMVSELVPEYPLALPSVGDRIMVWGITRYDLNHRWWEIHPVFGWKKL